MPFSCFKRPRKPQLWISRWLKFMFDVKYCKTLITLLHFCISKFSILYFVYLQNWPFKPHRGTVHLQHSITYFLPNLFEYESICVLLFVWNAVSFIGEYFFSSTLNHSFLGNIYCFLRFFIAVNCWRRAIIKKVFSGGSYLKSLCLLVKPVKCLANWKNFFVNAKINFLIHDNGGE